MTTYKMNAREFNRSLEEKAGGMSMLTSFLHDLGPHFFPYLRDAGAVILRMCGFYMSDEVRAFSISALTDMVECALGAMKMGKCTGEAVGIVFNQVMECTLLSIQREKDIDLQVCLVSSLRKCILAVEGITPLLTQPVLMAAMQAMLQLAQRNVTKIMSNEQRIITEELDVDAISTLEGHNAAKREVNYVITDAVGAFARIYKMNFVPVFQHLMPQLMSMLQHRQESARGCAIMFFDDLVEHCGPAATQYFDTFIPALLAMATDESLEVRQAAVYGLGVSAQFGGDAFHRFAAGAATRLVAAIRCPDAKDVDVLGVTDTAVSALGKVIKHQRRAPGVNSNELLPIFLAQLPLKKDTLEGHAVYAFVCDLLESRNQVALGRGQCNMPLLFSMLVRVMGTKFVNAQITERTGRLLAQLKSSTPPAQLTQIVSAMPTGAQAQANKLLASLGN